jgi:iron(III) transport system substrate-binding protein
MPLRVIFIAWFAVCAFPAAAAELLFYSGIPRNLTEPLLKAFQAKHPGTRVTMFQSGSEALVDKIELEIKGKGKPEADVVWIQDETTMARYSAMGLFEKYAVKDAAMIPQLYRDPRGSYYGTFVTPIVLLYNSKLVSGAARPASWTDLGDARFAGKLTLADPGVSGTGAAVASAMVQNFGWGFWEKVAQGKPLIVSGHNAMVSAIIAGERTLAPMPSHLVIPPMARSQPVDFVVPKEGALSVGCYTAIVKGTKALADARLLVDFFASKEAADIMHRNNMYHSRTDALPPKGWPKITEIKVLPMDWEKHGKEKDAVKQKFGELMIR